MSAIRYRPDIDGLRALAVLPVVAFHAGFSVLRGGFVGVDVFFVISGYLISRGIIEELRGGTFSLAAFYERRFRRIVPALATMLVVSTVAALLLLFPQALTSYAKSLAAATASLSNVWFFYDSGYFAGSASSKPLLHTWSLSVEEQYYLLMPLLLIAIHRGARPRLATIVWILATASLAISSIGAFKTPNAAFYLLHSRAWELLLGLLIFLSPPAILNRERVREVVGGAGLLLIVASLFLLSENMPFPGITALPPALGAAMLIATGAAGGSRANRLLSLKPVIWIGLISYSLYLWHWPVIVFAREGLFLSLASLPAKLAVVAISIILAILSWRFVERPFRTARNLGRRAIFGLSAAALVLLVGIGGMTIMQHGFPQRFPPAAMRMASWLEFSSDATFRDGRCFLQSDAAATTFDLATCLRDDPNKPNVLLIGDSQAAHLWWGLDRVMTGSDIWQITGAGCRPTFEDRLDNKPRCIKMHRVWKKVLAEKRPDLILLAGHWHKNDLKMLPDFIGTLRENGTALLVSGPIPDYDLGLPAILAFDAIHGTSSAGPHLRPDLAEIDRRIRELAIGAGASYVSMADTICSSGHWPCRVMANADVPMLFDSGHLTPDGSVVVASALRGADPHLKQ